MGWETDLTLLGLRLHRPLRPQVFWLRSRPRPRLEFASGLGVRGAGWGTCWLAEPIAGHGAMNPTSLGQGPRLCFPLASPEAWGLDTRWGRA